MLSGLTTNTTEQDTSGTHAIAQLLGALGALIIPALVLGTIIFKAFVADQVYTARKKLALLEPNQVSLDAEEKKLHRWLAIRLYSSTKLQLVDVRFEAYARVVGRSPSGSPTVTNVRLKLYKADWPVALTHVPYTVYSPLRETDIEERHGGLALRRIRALDGSNQRLTEGCDIVLIVSGRVPELGTDFIESHWFRADQDLGTGAFGEVAVTYPPDRKTWKESRKWDGWDRFDEPA